MRFKFTEQETEYINNISGQWNELQHKEFMNLQIEKHGGSKKATIKNREELSGKITQLHDYIVKREIEYYNANPSHFMQDMKEVIKTYATKEELRKAYEHARYTYLFNGDRETLEQSINTDHYVWGLEPKYKVDQEGNFIVEKSEYIIFDKIVKILDNTENDFIKYPYCALSYIAGMLNNSQDIKLFDYIRETTTSYYNAFITPTDNPPAKSGLANIHNTIAQPTEEELINFSKLTTACANGNLDLVIKNKSNTILVKQVTEIRYTTDEKKQISFFEREYYIFTTAQRRSKNKHKYKETINYKVPKEKPVDKAIFDFILGVVCTEYNKNGAQIVAITPKDLVNNQICNNLKEAKKELQTLAIFLKETRISISRELITKDKDKQEANVMDNLQFFDAHYLKNKTLNEMDFGIKDELLIVEILRPAIDLFSQYINIPVQCYIRIGKKDSAPNKDYHNLVPAIFRLIRIQRNYPEHRAQYQKDKSFIWGVEYFAKQMDFDLDKIKENKNDHGIRYIERIINVIYEANRQFKVSDNYIRMVENGIIKDGQNIFIIINDPRKKGKRVSAIEFIQKAKIKLIWDLSTENQTTHNYLSVKTKNTISSSNTSKKKTPKEQDWDTSSVDIDELRK